MTIAQSFYIENEGPIEDRLPVTPIELNNKSVVMDLDTVAGIPKISKKRYDIFFKDVPLEPSITKLHAYIGDLFKLQGQFTV